jgi:hypothetical protein
MALSFGWLARVSLSVTQIKYSEVAKNAEYSQVYPSRIPGRFNYTTTHYTFQHFHSLRPFQSGIQPVLGKSNRLHFTYSVAHLFGFNLPAFLPHSLPDRADIGLGGTYSRCPAIIKKRQLHRLHFVQ